MTTLMDIEAYKCVEEMKITAVQETLSEDEDIECEINDPVKNYEEWQER